MHLFVKLGINYPQATISVKLIIIMDIYEVPFLVKSSQHFTDIYIYKTQCTSNNRI